jgi:carbon-monoxide dehydrogenase medium subunit
MYPFAYLRPRSLAEAAERLAGHPDAKPLAGGMTLLPTLKQRLDAPSHLVDVARLAELHGIALDDRTLRIGAATRHAEVADSALVRQAVPGLATLAGLIGDAQVRNRGTLGGSVANSDPAADYPAALLALAATVVTDRRRLAADDFFTGLFETALDPGELIVAVEFTRPQRSLYAKQRHPASGYAVAGVFIARHDDGAVRVGVTGVGPCAFRWREAEARLGQRFDAAALQGLTLSPAGLNEDRSASAGYRAHLVSTLARRALADAAALCA